MISLIVAIAKNNVIGLDNDLPWHYPQDLKYFKQMTLNKTVLMGSKTFTSIVNRLSKPLPKRDNIVVTRNKSFAYPGVKVVHDLISFLEEPHEEEIFVIGGKEIYELSLPYADRLYITHIDKEYNGDVFFPKIDYNKYELISKTTFGELAFCIYEKVKQ